MEYLDSSPQQIFIEHLPKPLQSALENRTEGQTGQASASRVGKDIGTEMSLGID